jgi:pimeloyl-ACP methyl ester carboxylesterase
MQFDDEISAARALRALSLGFGDFSDEAWLALNRPMFRAANGGGIRLHYDPRIANNLQALTPALATAGEVQLWDAYDRLRLPTLVLRGAESDLLSAETATAMAARGPKARVVTLAGVGHAPMLDRPAQIAPVEGFLLAP